MGGTLGCASPSLVAVDLQSDYVPGVEFDEVVVTLSPASGGEERRVRHEVGAAADYIRGVRVADLPAVEPGVYWLTVELFQRSAPRPRARSRVQLEVASSVVLTVRALRSCDGVACPGPADPPGADQCMRGRCVPSRCLVSGEPQDDCPPPECETDADCPTPAACATARCQLGECFLAPEPDHCGAGLYCEPESGCVPVPLTPGALSATHEPEPPHAIRLHWEPSVGSAASMVLERQKEGGPWRTLVSGLAAEVDEHLDTWAVCDQRYRYRLRAATPEAPVRSVSSWVTATCDVFEDLDGAPLPRSFPAFIEEAFHRGLTTGCRRDGDRRFFFCEGGLEAPVTRAAAAVVLIRALNHPDLPYEPPGLASDPCADVPSELGDLPPSFEGFIEEMHRLHITGSCNQDPRRFLPLDPATRAAVAVWIVRALDVVPENVTPNPFVDVPGTSGLPPSFEDDIETAHALGIFEGCTAEPPSFCPLEDITRHALVVALMRAFDIPNPEVDRVR
ncbi:MAG TPA: hypothetical protein RMH99_28390 [Sandaracinaceae bacterium LLY-WYZ-13_1]|nr:hypothetical protein [Sandaracinaceae bacterium LLY-WYZ-13_1]